MLLGIGYGVVMGLIAAIPLRWVVLDVCLMGFPVSYFLWAIFVAPSIHFKYVGRVDT